MRPHALQGLKMLFGMESDNKIPSKITDADIHIVINVSTNELGDVRSYFDEVSPPPMSHHLAPTAPQTLLLLPSVFTVGKHSTSASRSIRCCS